MGASLEPNVIGQRVRVIAAQLVHFRQVGTVVSMGDAGGCYVHLDYDDDQAETVVFFHAEELEPAPEVPPRVPHRAYSTSSSGPREHGSGPR